MGFLPLFFLFLGLVIIPENVANLKRFQHGDSLTNNGLNFKLDPHWNGTYVRVTGGYGHPSTSPLSTSSTTTLGGSRQLTPLKIDIRMGFMIGSSRKGGDKEYSRPGLTIAGGLTYALYTLQQSKFFADLSYPTNINFLLTVAETNGDEDTSLRQVAQLWKQHNVSVIVGPQETCLHEARLASSLNIPMISYFCSDEATSDKRQFSTFSRSRPPDAAISRAVASLVLNYRWCDSLTVIYSNSSDDQRFKRVAKSLSLLFRERGVSTHPEISYPGPYHHGYGDNPFDGIVAQTKETTRIYIIISEYFEHLGLVLALKKHNLLESGEYLVIGVSMDDFKEDIWNPRRYFRGLLTDENETEAPSAFRSYLGIVASAPKNFTEFSRHVNHFMEMEPFRFQNPLSSIGGYKNIRIEAAYLYDAVMLYAHVIRSILQEYFFSVFSTVGPDGPSGFRTSSSYDDSNNRSHSPPSPRSNRERDEVQPQRQATQQQRLIPHGTKGKLAIRHRRDHVSVLTGEQTMTSSSFGNIDSAAGITSTSLSGNSNNRKTNGFVIDERRILAKIRDGREVSRRLRNIRYRSATGHESKMDENGDAEGNFTLVALKSKNNEIGLYPVGFFMRSTAQLPELTLTDTIDWVAGNPPVSQPECGFHGEKCESDTISMWALGTGVLCIAFVASAMYLIFRHWRLSRDMDDLLWKIDKKDIEWETDHLFPMVRGGGRMIMGSQASLARFSTVFTSLVSYRERIFAAKALNLRCHLDTALKHQLKMLREIRHENLNAFIGACVFEEGLLLVYEYCSRGSIKDILENGDLKLDDMFVSSLVGDLLRGLSYLHDSSQFRYHGNLKPTNCLIDSRWNLKLSDFGIKPYEYKLRRTTDLIVPPTCNLASTTGGISTSRSLSGLEDHTKSSASVVMSGGHHNSLTGRTSQSFSSSFHGPHMTQITSPYLAPEYPLLIKTREEAIFLHNQPGFCYQRNGKPRYVSSLHESKSRKIVSDMDGREGLRPNPALNVVSDTPTLAEVLSSPEIVQILCELRNTAALMSNEKLFQAFADQLGKSHRKFPFFKEFQGPLDYLKQYRRNLIQEFFDTLKTEAEMRLFVVPVDPTTGIYPPRSENTPMSSIDKVEDDDDGHSLNSYFVSGGSTNEDDGSSGKTYDPNLSQRIVRDAKNARDNAPMNKIPGTGGDRQDHGGVLRDSTTPTDGDENKEEQNTSVFDSNSKQEVLVPTDFIPTSEGYMTVEDWNIAVLEQLKRSQQEEERRKLRKKAHKMSSSDNEQDPANIIVQHQQQLKALEEELANYKEKGDDPVDSNADVMEELRVKMAAAVAAEEAKYMLDQKIMGLAGITTLYKSNNIGFAKYFEHKDVEGLVEMKRNEKKSTRFASDDSTRETWLAHSHLRNPAKNELDALSMTNKTDLSTGDTNVDSGGSNRRMQKAKSRMKESYHSSRTKELQRKEFNHFVRQLISNIELISAVDRQVSSLSRRKPIELQRYIGPLRRLMKRKNLFDTLNAEDIFFSDFDGGRQELERIVASHLPPTAKPKPGGFTFKVPSRTSLEVVPGSDGKSPVDYDPYSDECMCYPRQYSSSSSSPPTTARSNKSASSGGSKGNRIKWYRHNLVGAPSKKYLTVQESCWVHNPKSLRRVCCPACRLKAYEACHSVLKRDQNCKLTLSMNSWKIPGVQPHHLRKRTEESVQSYPSKQEAKIPAKLRKGQHQKSCVDGLRKGDIYSLGIILWELIRRETLSSFLGLKDDKEIRERICHGISIPFQASSKMSAVNLELDPDELFWPTTLQSFELPFDEKKQHHQAQHGLLQQNGRSNNSGGISHFDQIRECLKDCLSYEPETRPDIKAVRMRLRPLHKGMRSNIFDIMIGLMEKYANNLEILVDDRTKQLSEEKRKTESLLYELIPESVAQELKEGLRVPAQSYDCVSIYFSDIVGFTSMSAQSTPLQVVEFLNDLYTCFDSIIASFDVYKVETIGDAYMVASGLPEVREGNSHAVDVANMALKLVQEVEHFRIRHRPTELLELRIGIHSGPCCAGVVGLKRPRYCLFGDTVNTASRMESTGEPRRIHCSEMFANLIQNDPNPQFELEERGLVDIKGKGDMKTYWLNGKRVIRNTTQL